MFASLNIRKLNGLSIPTFMLSLFFLSAVKAKAIDFYYGEVFGDKIYVYQVESSQLPHTMIFCEIHGKYWKKCYPGKKFKNIKNKSLSDSLPTNASKKSLLYPDFITSWVEYQLDQPLPDNHNLGVHVIAMGKVKTVKDLYNYDKDFSDRIADDETYRKAIKEIIKWLDSYKKNYGKKFNGNTNIKPSTILDAKTKLSFTINNVEYRYSQWKEVSIAEHLYYCFVVDRVEKNDTLKVIEKKCIALGVL